MVNFKSFGLIEADYQSAAECFLEWQRGIYEGSGTYLESKSIRYIPEKIFDILKPLTAPVPTRYVFMGTHSKWSVFLENFILGTDAGPPMKVLAGKMKCRSLRVVCAEHTLPSKPKKEDKGEYGAVIFSLFDEVRKISRSIYTANDGGRWVFGAHGEPLDFEDLNAYQKKKIRERFTPEMLKEYLMNLGAYPFDESWYKEDMVFIEKKGKLPPSKTEHY